MAAPSNTVWGSTVGDYVRVGISVSQSYTNTQCTVTTEVWFWTKWSLTDSNYNLYFDFDSTSATTSVPKETNKITTSVDSGTWSNSNQVLLGTYTKVYDRTTDGFSQNCAVKVNGIDKVSGSDITATTSYTVDALPKLTLTLNKTEGIKSFTGGGQYPYGATAYIEVITEDGYHLVDYVGTSWDGKEIVSDPAAVAGKKEFSNDIYMIVDRTFTVYAERDTYTVSYNANGGSGAPNDQIKTYGIDLTLSSIIPTREGYKFLGWALSKEDADNGYLYYFSGDNCGKNENLILYAVWEMLGTLHINQKGVWKTGLVWIKDNGDWKRGVPHIKVNGVWKRGG